MSRRDGSVEAFLYLVALWALCEWLYRRLAWVVYLAIAFGLGYLAARLWVG